MSQIQPEGQSLTLQCASQWSGGGCGLSDHDACAPSPQGSQGFAAQVNKCLENAEYLYDLLQRRRGFQLVFQDKVKSCNRFLSMDLTDCYYYSITASLL